MLHTETWLISFCLNPIKYIRPIMEQQEVNYCNHIPSSLAAASLPDIQKPQLDLFWTIWNIQIIIIILLDTLKVLLWLLKLKIFPSNKRKIKFICQWRILFSESGLPSLWSDDWCVGAGSNTERGDQTTRHWTLDTVQCGHCGHRTLDMSTEQNFTVYTC